MNRFAIVMSVIVGAMASACDKGPCGMPANSLAGSVSELLDITADSVKIKKVDETNVTVEFYHGTDVVAKVVVDTRSYAKGAKIPLTDGQVYRLTEPPTDFPSDIERGDVTFESELTIGTEVSGCFTTLFNMEDGSQRTLDGAFSGTLGDVGS